MIQLNKADFEKMLAHATKELPDEACGLIAGEVQGTNKIVRKVYLLTNIDHSNEHFSLDPKEQLAAVKDMRGQWTGAAGELAFSPRIAVQTVGRR